MHLRTVFALLLCFSFSSFASAQLVRFETSVGDFDMVLNPTQDARLQGHVDNMLSYVEGDFYNCSVINRAAENFVLQMGGFRTQTLVAPSVVEGFVPIDTFAPIEGEPAAELGFSNTRGTIAMALPGNGFGGTNQDGGTSSFFINIDGNEFLDTDFTVFAVIADMSTIDDIMGLSQLDLANDFGTPGNLAFSDVPVQDNGNLVFIKQAYVVDDTLAIAAARNAALQTLFNPPAAPTAAGQNAIADFASAASTSQASSASSSAASSSSIGLASLAAVPEPTGLFLLLATALGLFASRRTVR